MKEIEDKIWLWRGWQSIKWFFGFFLLIFIISQIWFSSTIKDYNQFIIVHFMSFKVNIPTWSMPDGFFKKERMIKEDL